MRKTVRVSVKSSAHTHANGTVHVRTTVSGGGKTRTISKTYRVK